MRRPGITLLEVLSAIFIAGIGLLSLLTLFPLGALKMLESVNDDRAAQAGGNAKAIANAVVMRQDPDVQAAMLNQVIPSTGTGPLFPAIPSPVPADGPGLPVLVDPIGVLAYTGQGLWPTWAGGTQYVVPRVRGQWLRPLNGVSLTTADYIRWCTLLDDINFSTNNDQGATVATNSVYPGSAMNPPAWAGGIGQVERIPRFTYAWMMRMPRAASPNVVDVSVLVFAGRSLDFVGFSSQEGAYTAVFNAPANTVAIYPNATAGTTAPPDLRRGQWILDTSLAPPSATAPLSVRGFFYRVVSVSDPAVDANGNPYVTAEVQTPLRGWTTPDPAFQIYPPQPGFPPSSIPTVGQLGSVLVFDNLLEVFDDGTF